MMFKEILKKARLMFYLMPETSRIQYQGQVWYPEQEQKAIHQSRRTLLRLEHEHEARARQRMR